MPHPKWCFFAAVFGNVVSAATSARLGGIVDLVISNTSPYRPHVSSAAPFTIPSTPQPKRNLTPAQAEDALPFTRACLHLQQNAYNGLSSKNGAPAFGSFNVAGSNSNSGGGVTTITLKYELHLRPLDGGEGPKTPMLIPYIKFSLFDFDHGGDGTGQEVSRAPWPCPWLRPTVATHHLAVRRSFGVLRLCALRSYRRNNSNNATGV